jgi:hypothetical protein
MVSRIAGTLALLLALTVGGAAVQSMPPGPLALPPLTTALPQQIAPTIAGLQALGAGGTTAGIAYVENYAHPNDGGGGIFVWLPTATSQPDNCLTFAVPGISTGLWQRQLNGIPFNADMCGTGNADDSVAINAAFQVCFADKLPLVFSAKTYRVAATLTVPTSCPFHGAAATGFGAPSTVFDFRTAPASVTTLMSMVGAVAFGSYGAGTVFGDFQILDNYTVPRTGLYISRVANIQGSDIAVFNVLGTGIFLGLQQQASYRNIMVDGSGSPTAAELDIDGESSGGQNYASTTTTLYDPHVEIAGKQGTPCGIAINRNELLTIIGGDSENNGTLLCVANKPVTGRMVLSIAVEHFDMESPGSGGQNYCVSVGTGGAGVLTSGVRFIGNNCIPVTSNTTAYYVANTTDFYATGNFVNFLSQSQVYFDFEGTNTGTSLGWNTSDFPVANVMTNGQTRPYTVSNQPWSMQSVFAGAVSLQYGTLTFATLPACVAANLGAHAYITDAASTTFFAVAAGGGKSTAPVGCDGTNWRIGG